MRIAYADPPYPGQSRKHYKDHPDYAGEVDHDDLIRKISKYDGWILHTSSVSLREILPFCDGLDYRIMAWTKPFCAFKRNVPVAYSWEPVLVSPCRKPTVGGSMTLRDHISESITMKRGLAGAKPERVCWWAFECVGALPEDELDDMFPGTGAVTRAWESWRSRPKQGCLSCAEDVEVER